MIGRRVFIYFGMCFMLFAMSGCDHTDLTGEVILPDTVIEVGDKVPLKLEVPDELSGIYRTMWTVDPRENGDIIEGEDVFEELSDDEIENYFGSKEDINKDRIAIFIAKEKGKCTIDVAGFYKQTNPQGITSIELEIH